jgi:hypothetical protein
MLTALLDEDDHVATALPKVGIFHPLDLRLGNAQLRPVSRARATAFFRGVEASDVPPCWASHIALRPCPCQHLKQSGLAAFAFSTRNSLGRGR